MLRYDAMTDEELEALLVGGESDRVERTSSTTDTDKFCEAVCAFANDLPDNREPGVLFIGVNNNGACANIAVTDRLLQALGGLRSDGNIIPLPSIVVQHRRIRNCDVAVVVVRPSYDPPVRYKGRVHIRVGPRKAIASQDEERRLVEKRRSRDLPFDLTPVRSASFDALDLDFFRRIYLPAAVAPEILERNQRTAEEQLLSLRFIYRDRENGELFPTVVGLLTIGKEPREYIPGAYVQFIRFEGRALTDPIKDQREISGSLSDVIREMDEVFKANITVKSEFQTGIQETRQPDYPLVALQQIARNAVLHRNYEATNAPTRINWFDDRIEILSPGGPFGQVTVENFGQPGVADYRNAHIAEVLKVLGYVQRFAVGIATARSAMQSNGNPAPEFTPQVNNVFVVLRRQ